MSEFWLNLKNEKKKKKKPFTFYMWLHHFFLSATDLHRLKQHIYCFKLDLEITQKHTETKVYVFSLLQVHRKGFDS